jgi:hypothetical protein
MKKALLILVFLLFYSYSHAQSDSLLRIRLIDFLISTGDLLEDSEPTNTMLIINNIVTYTELKNQSYGIFKFGTLTTHSYFHILLKDESDYKIIDMRQPIEDVFQAILKCMANKTIYTKSDIVAYLNAIISLYKSNDNSIPWKVESILE